MLISAARIVTASAGIPGSQAMLAPGHLACADGKIVSVGAGPPPHGKPDVQLHEGFLVPGFVDLHIHAPQYPQLGKALDCPLEEWLTRYAFPLEARYADAAFAHKSYHALVSDLAANGTTTAVMYGTIHEAANRVLVDACLEGGLRAYVGKVAMDNPDTCPENYRDSSSKAALAGTQALIDYVKRRNSDGLVRPVVTPRFIPSCTDATLQGLAAIGRAEGCHFQTHCSESDWQHRYVLERYGRSDAQSLDRFGLMSERTILAHAALLSRRDMDLVRSRGSAIAHCPLSNVYFSNAVFPLRAALAKGLRVGLGTDISGGPSASLFDTLRMCIAGSRLLEEGVDPDLPPERRGRKGSRIDWRMAFFLATAGGADALGVRTGRFMPGNEFDAMIVDTQAREGSIRIFDEIDTIEDVLPKILYGASRRNISAVYVAGRAVA